MRIITPVRLASELGSKLDSDIAQTRQILERFQKGGFNYAIWAVDKLPEKQEDIMAWADKCLDAFPGQVVIALDGKLEPQNATLNNESLAAFLKHVLPKAHSIMVNYGSLSNCSYRERTAEAIAQVRANIELVRSISPKTFIWLLLEDCPKSCDKIPEWTASLGNLVDGYQLWQDHGINAINDDRLAKVDKPLLDSGKPVIRGNFMYMSPRLRPGLEEDLREQYNDRLGRYEIWLAENRFTGYSRLIGDSVPQAVCVNMNYLQER